ncbi:dihydrolipoamide acetyltransferase family protein [Motiliproteus sp. MSK22-1]|uniref:dihydrolipoamide acetyltransferase family protein n=1 Tax=Motiliproteus sp. MSK22-1 TaxID=1897630 RepID=UPI00097802E8|nr:2-oxo acid dehydrogenase subunit E2 [Motiliproteus sp. MSK22-1]OMH27126.1 dihydrolipoamide succinyltransferase [Motiliproteus sp. MSK22-1]
MNNLVDIVLPAEQLEGTSAVLSKWLIDVGSSVKSGDPIIELETDKVSMEICSPADGILQETRAQEGDEVEVEFILGRLSESEVPTEVPTNDTTSGSGPAEDHSLAETATPSVNKPDTDSNDARALVGPAVRRMLRQHDLDIEQIPGSGRRGRVTLCDVRHFLTNPTPKTEPQALNSIPQVQTSPYGYSERQPRPLQGTKVPHSTMRKAIANHMVDSLLNISPHVTSVFEMDMSNIIEHRKWHKKEFSQLDANLTFTAYFLAASVQAIHAVPQVNARFHDDALELFDDINIGVGTALGDDGLVVPVVQQVQEMNLFEIAHALSTQTEKARSGKLTPADMKNGTFTISNHGVSGSLFAAPIIINQPQVAILGIGKLDKRVVVEEVNGVDTMVIKPMCYVSLSMDHRALDAHQTNKFLTVFVETIEQWGL